MTIPNQSFNILTNGIGFGSDNGSRNILVIGPGNTNAIGVITQVTSPVQAKSLYGYSPISEALSIASSTTPSSVYALSCTYTATAINDAAMIKSRLASPDVLISGVAELDCTVKIKFTSASKFVYSLDNGLSYSQEQLASGDVIIESFTITFPSGTYATDDIYSYAATGKKIVSSDLDDVFLKIKESDKLFSIIALYDGINTAATSTTLFTAAKTQMESLAALNGFARLIMDFGSAESLKSTVISAVSDLVSDRISIVTDASLVSTVLSRPGWTYPKLGLVLPVIGRVAKALISEDLGQVNKGALDYVYKIENDQRVNPNGLDDNKIITPMTYKGRPGYYVTNSHLKSAPTSDFKYLQHGRVMDTACTISSLYQPELLKTPIKTISGGYIDPVQAISMEKFVEGKLKSVLMEEVNSGNFAGHVSNLAYQIRRTNNVILDETIYVDIYMRPLGYANSIIATIGFSTK